MRRPTRVDKAGFSIILFMIFVSTALAETGNSNAKGSPASSIRSPRFIKAFVVDDRLSALRRDADMQSEVMQRLRLGRRVLIIGTKAGRKDNPTFYRVAVTRRTRGWIHHSALAVPGRPGEDARTMRLIETASDGLDRIELCGLFIERFARSAIAPRVMLALAEEADRAASTLTRRARKRLAKLDEENLKDYYLNDPGLDRYSKLRVKFDFNQATTQYVYDGQAYREIIKRFPESDEAKRARQRLDRVEQRLARQ
jgi:hypothetical protein